MYKQKEIPTLPIINYISAVSVGLKNGQALLDLNYDEDSQMDTDMNFVINNDLNFIEIQGTAEKMPFNKEQLDTMIKIGTEGCKKLFVEQQKILGEYLPLKL